MEKEENQNSNSDSVEEIKDNEDTDKSTEKSEDLQPDNKIKELVQTNEILNEVENCIGEIH